jgi:hypothetical protein
MRAGAGALPAWDGHDSLVPEIRAAALTQVPAGTGLDGVNLSGCLNHLDLTAVRLHFVNR